MIYPCVPGQFKIGKRKEERKGEINKMGIQPVFLIHTTEGRGTVVSKIRNYAEH